MNWVVNVIQGVGLIELMVVTGNRLNWLMVEEDGGGGSLNWWLLREIGLIG